MGYYKEHRVVTENIFNNILLPDGKFHNLIFLIVP